MTSSLWYSKYARGFFLPPTITQPQTRLSDIDFCPHAPNSLNMHRNRIHVFQHLAAILLLLANLVPEALAALPVCQYDFAPAQTSVSFQTLSGGLSLGHSHDTQVAHECVATMPDEVCAARVPHSAPDMTDFFPITQIARVKPVIRGVSPRGSPSGANTYLAQRSSVLLLI